MNEPLRLCDDDCAQHAQLRALLQTAQPPGPLPASVRERVGRELSAAQQRAARGFDWTPALVASIAVAACALGMVAPAPAGPKPHGATRPPAVDDGLAAHGEPTLERQAHDETRGVPAASGRPASEVVAQATRVQAVEPRPEHASRTDRKPPSAALRQRWQQQRWANQAKRSRQRVEAIIDEILRPEVKMLERAKREVESDPEQALALIEAFRKRYPEVEVPAPNVVVEVDALRRLGRFEEALARARRFVDVSKKDYYADEMVERFALLEL